MSASWRSYQLIPEDVLFFRDGKPATMGEDHYLRSIFPPYPSTLYGMARTQRMLDAGCDLSRVSESWWKALPEPLRAEIGEWCSHGSLTLRGPWLVSDDAILLPAPHDLLVIVEAADGSRKVTEVLRLLREAARDGQPWSHGMAAMTPYIHRDGRWSDWNDSGDPKEPEPASGWFLTIGGIERWMNGGVPLPEDFVDSAILWSVEMRTGVGLQKERRMSKDSMLYTFGFIRLERGVSIGFELTGGTIQSSRHVRVGGEGKLALLNDGPSLTGALGNLAQSTEGDAVIALLTPGIFAKGSSPGTNVSAAVVSEAVRVGGWDLARREPKPLFRAAPAGSVYYVDGQPIEQLQSFSEQANEGFGLMLRGNRPRR
jgi:CRISPR-associated protein Cmr3